MLEYSWFELDVSFAWATSSSFFEKYYIYFHFLVI